MSGAAPMDARRLRHWARSIKAQLMVLYLVARHPQTPRYVKVLAALVVGYALSPIDLIPDFIPILGFVDDVLIVPLGIALCLRLAPPPVVEACRAQALRSAAERPPRNLLAGALVVLAWVIALSLIGYLLIR